MDKLFKDAAEKNDSSEMVRNVELADRKMRRFYQQVADLQSTLDVLAGTVGVLSKSLLEFKIDQITSEYDDLKRQYDMMVDNPLYYDIEDDFRKIRKEYNVMMEGLSRKLDDLNNESQISTIQSSLKVPTFSGKIDEWPVFQEMFRQLVEGNKSLTAANKFSILKNVVQGEAGELIDQLPETESSYETAWIILKDRYENRRLIFSTLVDKILDHPTVNFQDKDAIKQLVDTTTACIETLKAMKISMNDADPFIARTVVKKLDKEGLLCYEQNISKFKEMQTLESVMTFLGQQYCARAGAVSDNENACNISAPAQPHTSRQTNVKNKYCGFCKSEGHLLTDCSGFAAEPVLARIKWVNKAQKCKICLSHRTQKPCFKRNTNCENCGKKHHTLLHYNKNDKKPTTEQQLSTLSPPSIEAQTPEKHLWTFLSTAQLRIKSARGEDLIFRALISPNSEKTLISSRAANLLRLPRQKANIEVWGIIGSSRQGVAKSIMNLKIQPRFQSDVVHKVKAVVFENMSLTLPHKTFDVNMSDWQNYCLADATFNISGRIDVVIASDLYYQILQKDYVRRENIQCQKTTLGWLLSGQHEESIPQTMHIVSTTYLKYIVN